MNPSQDLLRHARRRLDDQWRRAREHWQGVTAEHFEQHGWTQWEAEAQAYQKSLEAMHEALADVKRLHGPG